LTQVQVRPNESLDSALKRFKKVIQQTGILKEAREHEHYEKPSDKKRKRKGLTVLSFPHAPGRAKPCRSVSWVFPRVSPRRP
jgi:small subunit ribosomal protein S21